MKIGELSSTSGTPVETIRFYEREALLPAPQRTESNYRVYTQQHADRLGFIRQCRNLDMTLDDANVTHQGANSFATVGDGSDADDASIFLGDQRP